MVMWVCEAWQVNIWTVFAVRPNGPNKNKNFASSRSDHLGSDKHTNKIISQEEIVQHSNSCERGKGETRSSRKYTQQWELKYIIEVRRNKVKLERWCKSCLHLKFLIYKDQCKENRLILYYKERWKRGFSHKVSKKHGQRLY